MVTVAGARLRPLPTELRRSAAPAAATAVAVILTLLLWIRTDEKATGWTGLALTFRNDLTALVPAVLAAGAWQGGRERRARTEELLDSTPRPVRSRVLVPTAAVVLGALAGVSAPLAAAGITDGRGRWLGQWWPAAVVATGLLALAAAVVLGVGLGRSVRSNLVAPLAAVAVFLPLLSFYAASYEDTWPLLLTSVMEPSTSDLERIRDGATGGQALWLTGLLLSGAALAVARRRRTRLLAALPALTALAVAVPLLAAGGGAAFTVDPVAARPVCTDGGPQVCVAMVHRDLLPAVTASARVVLVALRRLPEPPTRALEVPLSFPAVVPPPDVLPLAEVDVTARTRGDGLTDRIAYGLAVQLCDAEPPGGYERDGIARAVAGAWLLGRARTTRVDPEADRILQRLRRLPEAEQVRRVAAARAAFRGCDQDALAELP